MVEQAIDEFGGLDVLVNNAGILRKGPMLDLSEKDLDDLLHVHVKGTAVPLHHAGNYWRRESEAGLQRAAAVVNTSSRAGLAPRVPQIAWYGAAKGAIATLTPAQRSDGAWHRTMRSRRTASRDRTRRGGRAADAPSDHAIGLHKVAPAVAWLRAERAAQRSSVLEKAEPSHYEKWGRHTKIGDGTRPISPKAQPASNYPSGRRSPHRGPS